METAAFDAKAFIRALQKQGKLLFWAVYHFGRRWQSVTRMEVKAVTTPDGKVESRPVTVTNTERLTVKPPTDADVALAKDAIEKNNPSIEDLKKLAPAGR